MANLTPFAVDWPPAVQTGRSDPILMVPFDPVPPPLLPPQASPTNTATVRTASPLARTIWFPLVLSGGRNPSGGRLPSLAALFPTRVGARVRRRRMRPHGVAEPLLRAELSTCACLEVKHRVARPPAPSPSMTAALYQYGSVAL